MLKKATLLLILFVLVIPLLTGCGKKPVVDMASPSAEGRYPYSNQDLGFAINLPKEFQYYQVQRKNNDDFTDIEFYIPTSDTKYAQEVPGYAKPFTIRVMDKSVWEATDNKFDKTIVKEIARDGNKVYTIIFWQDIPKDWTKKWNDELKRDIINNFKLL